MVRIFSPVIVAVILTAIVAGIIFIASKGPADEEKVKFRLRLEKGQKYYMKTVNEQKISQTVKDQPQNIEQTTGIGINFDVNDVDDHGNMDLICTYVWTQFGQEGPMGVIEYDSAKEDVSVPPSALGYKALIGEGYSLKLTPTAYVLSIGGLEKMRESIRKKLPQDSMVDQIMMSLRQYITDNAIRHFTQGAMGIYPDNPVAVGDTWTKRIDLFKGVAMSIESDLTLKERKDNVATLEVTSKIEPISNVEPADIGSMKMTHKLSGTQKGLMYVRESTGLITKSKVEQDISGEMTVINSMEPPQELVIPTTIRSVITTEITERGKGTCKK
jgi:hypothetical protein